MKYTGIIVKFKDQPSCYEHGVLRILPKTNKGSRRLTFKVNHESVQISNKLVTITVNENGSFTVLKNEKNA